MSWRAQPVGEILKQASWSDAPATTGHFRTEAGDEADLVLERDNGQVIAFEIKTGSGSAATTSAACGTSKNASAADSKKQSRCTPAYMPTPTTAGPRSFHSTGSGPDDHPTAIP
jgi:hypothetical protein